MTRPRSDTRGETRSRADSLATTVGRGIGAARVGLGLAALAAPGLIGRMWIGPAASGRGTAVLARALAGRDIALGTGAVIAEGDDERRRWVMLGAASDLVDTVATVVAFTHLPRGKRWLVLAACAGAAAGNALCVALSPRARPA